MEQTDKQYTDNMIHTDTKAQATKAKKKKKLDLIKIYYFCVSKDTTNKMKR